MRPRNVVKKFAFATRVGYDPSDVNKVNQDTFILTPNINKKPALHMFGVCDGHGVAGKEAATFVKYALPIAVEEGLPDEENDNNFSEQNCGFDKSERTLK